MRLTQVLKTVLAAYVATLCTVPNLARADATSIAQVVVCGNPSSTSQTLELLDYYELQQSGGRLRLNSNLDSYSAILRQLFQSWKSVAPKRITLYERWLSEFESEAGFHSNIHIVSTGDQDPTAIIADCDVVPIAYQHPAEDLFQNVKRYEIVKNLWDRLTEIQKAGLVLHELIDRERIQIGQTSPFPTRYFNRYLASATPQSLEYTRVIQQLPLEWVEYGSGLILELKKVKVSEPPPVAETYSTITESDYVSGITHFPPLINDAFVYNRKGRYKGFVGDIASKHLKIHFKSFSPETIYYDADVMIINNRVLLSDLSNTQVETILAAVDGASIELDHLPFQTLSYELTNINNRLQIQLKTQAPLPDALSVNPSTSFYIQSDGSIIGSIAKILKSRNCSFECPMPDYPVYGDAFITSSDVTWVYDFGTGRYIRK